jgi:hypothetical protein
MKKENYLLAVSYDFNSILMDLFGVSSWRDFTQRNYLKNYDQKVHINQL